MHLIPPWGAHETRNNQEPERFAPGGRRYRRIHAPGGPCPGPRHIEHGDLLVPAVQQLVYQRRSATTNIDYRRVRFGSGCLDEIEGPGVATLVPTHLIGRFGLVDLFPMRTRFIGIM